MFISLFVGTFIVSASQAMAIASLPDIMLEFSFGAGLGQLFTVGYMVVLGVAAAFTAYFIDWLPLRRLYVGALLVFALCSLGIVWAPTTMLIITLRLVSALSAGMMLPLLQTVALSIYPSSHYGRALTLVSIVVGISPAVGPLIAGVLIDLYSWRAVFIGLGLSVGACALAGLHFVYDVLDRRPHSRLDALSAILYLAGFSISMAAISLISNESLPLILRVFLVLLGLGSLVAFVRRQLRQEDPFFALQFFSHPGFSASVLVIVASQLTATFGSVVVPLYAQAVLGFSASVSGWIIFPGAFILGIGSILTGRLSDRRGVVPLVLVGIACSVVGSAGFLVLGSNPSPWLLALLYALRLSGVACITIPLTAHACACLPRSCLSQASSMITSLRQTLGSLLSSVLIMVMAASTSHPSGIDRFSFCLSFVIQIVLVLGVGSLGLVGLRQNKASL